MIVQSCVMERVGFPYNVVTISYFMKMVNCCVIFESLNKLSFENGFYASLYGSLYVTIIQRKVGQVDVWFTILNCNFNSKYMENGTICERTIHATSKCLNFRFFEETNILTCRKTEH